MKLAEYVPLAMRTMSPHSPTGKWEIDYLIHGTMGILTELMELTNATSELNEAEETSDILWFTAAIVKAAGLEYTEVENAWNLMGDIHVVGLKPARVMNKLFEETIALTDLLKRQLFYGPSINLERYEAAKPKIQDLATGIYYLAMQLCKTQGYEPGKIMVLNIAKLSRRYGDRFTDVQALCRDTEAEFKAMAESKA